MLIRDFPPHPVLRTFIQCYRICHFEFASASAIPVKSAAPKPENILHFFLRDFWAIQKPRGSVVVQPSTVLIGQRTTMVRQFTGQNFLNVQIVFQPTGIYALTGIPATELINQHIDASLVFGSSLRDTFDKLQHAKQYSELLSIIEDLSFMLVRRARREDGSVGAIARQMIRQGGIRSLDQLADDACLSPKQFRRRFYESAGINPKAYSRIIRMIRAYNIRNAYPDRDWLEVAISCGYQDYQHMVKDYKDFVGFTPVEFELLEEQTPERILGLAGELYKDRVPASPDARK